MAADCSSKKEEESEPFVARRAESSDSEGVASLVKRQTESIFGRLDPDVVIEKANLAITLANDEGKLLAFAAFYDYPSVPSVEQCQWEKWLQTSYNNCSQANSMNSLFLKLFVAQDGYSQGALTELLKTAFLAVPLLQFIFMCPFTAPDQTLSLHFSPLQPFAEESPPVYITYRHKHYPMLHIRSATVEDNDDLLPIMRQCSPNHLTNQYGDYFIAELIESQDKDHQTIVAEVDGRAVGFISITNDVNLSLLWEHYQLESYHGLRKPCDEDVITTTANLESHKTSRSSVYSSNKATERVSVSSMADDKSITEDKIEHSSGTSEKSSVATPSIVEEETKEYILTGPSNVIAIQLFCISEQYEMRSIDLLPSVFKLFPGVDFLILTLPSCLPHFPLLSHFTRISLREGSTLNQELYILHKASLLHSLQVRTLKPEDVSGIEALVSSLTSERKILEDVHHYVTARRDPLTENGTPIHTFVVELLQQIVGVVILRQEENLRYLISHYNIEDYVYFNHHSPDEHMHLHHFLVNPVFAPHIRHILKECMRLSHSNNLYYPLPLNIPHSLTHSLTLAQQEMVPVRPRRQIRYPEGLGTNAPISEIREHRPNITLYHTNRKLSLEPKIPINTRIVFVGASDTALACMETLVFSPHLKFNNLILVSPQGLSNTSRVLPDSCCFFDDALTKIGLEAWITTIPGSLLAIDRVSQCITVETSQDSNLLRYDCLVLCTGVQYIPEQPLEGSIPQTYGIITLTGDNRDEETMKRTREDLGEEDNVVVYGSTLDAYCTVHYLLKGMGFPGSRVTWVQPYTPTCFKSAVVADKIRDSVSSSGVTVMENYVVHRYFTQPSSAALRAVELIDDSEHMTTIPCKVMFCVETKEVNTRSFQAINDACLVYDKRLVVDPQHSTNDPKILGAGPLTKFSRYYRTPWTHKSFNSHEVGERLAQTLLSKFDPTYLETNESETTQLIPSYTQPKETFARLPGGYYYLYIDKPKADVKAEKTKLSEKGQYISTDTENGYFELYINQYHRLESITVLSDKMYEVSNFRCLYNQHEQYLNNLLTRWKHQLIPDLFLYFREQWVCAVFHDRFPDFLREIDELISQGEGSLRDKVKEIIDDSSKISLEDNQEKISKAFEATNNLEDSLYKRLHRYLVYNSNHLPMYAAPDMI